MTMRSNHVALTPTQFIPISILIYLCCSHVLGFVNNVHTGTMHRVQSLLIQQTSSENDEFETGSASKAWVPPSMNTEQRHGNIFSIKNPEDLLDFISEDDRLCVVKIYANWCRTCKAFNTRYRKVVSRFGDKYEGTQRIHEGRARFAEMELNGSNAKFLKAFLGTEGISLPYILMYRGPSGLVKNFDCAPKNIHILVDAVSELSTEVESSHCSEPAAIQQYGYANDLVHSVDASDAVQPRLNKSNSKSRGLGVTYYYLSNLSQG